MNPDGPSSGALWMQYVTAYREFINARMGLFHCDDLVDLVRRGLNDPLERAAALDIARLLRDEQKKELFPDLVALSSTAHGLTDDAIQVMMSLSKDWILANIQPLVESILSNASDEEYRMVLRIYAGLSTSLARDLAVRAMNHPDPDIREAGDDWCSRLKGNENV